MIKYDKFFQLLDEKGISHNSLVKNYYISKSLSTKMHRNEGLTTHTINYLCAILQCNAGDIMEYVYDPSDLDAVQKQK